MWIKRERDDVIDMSEKVRFCKIRTSVHYLSSTYVSFISFCLLPVWILNYLFQLKLL